MARDFDASAMEWRGLLIAAAELDLEVTLHVAGGHDHHCRIDVVGLDVLAATSRRGNNLLIRISEVSRLSLPGGALNAGLDEPHTDGPTLLELAEEWAGQRRRVTVSAGVTTTQGTLAAVGVDMLSLIGDNGRVSYVRAESVSVIASSES